MGDIITVLGNLLRQGKAAQAAACVLPTLAALPQEQKLEMLGQLNGLARHTESGADIETQEGFLGHLLLGCGFDEEGRQVLARSTVLREAREKALAQGVDLSDRTELYRLLGAQDFQKYSLGRSRSPGARLLLDENTVAYLVMSQQMEKLLPVLTAFPGASWITVGDGRHAFEARFIAKHGGKVMPTNLDITLLKEAKEQGYIEDYREENLEKLTFADNSYDFACCKETLHHLLHPYLGLYEMLRVAREGIFLLEPFDKGCQNSVLLGTRPQHAWHEFEEEAGNYVYTLSEREVEKFAVSQNIPFVAFRGINMVEGEGIAGSSTDERDLRRQRARVDRMDALCRKGKIPWRCLGALLLKRSPSPALREALIGQGFTLLDLPRNPHLERAALLSLQTRYELEGASE